MPFVKPHTDSAGNLCAESFWTVAQDNFCALKGRESGHVVFYGYKDKASYDAGLSPLPGAVKAYSLSGPSFLAVASAAPDGQTVWDVVANAVESYASATKDTGSGRKDADGNPVPVSFFDGAQHVSA